MKKIVRIQKTKLTLIIYATRAKSLRNNLPTASLKFSLLHRCLLLLFNRYVEQNVLGLSYSIFLMCYALTTETTIMVESNILARK